MNINSNTKVLLKHFKVINFKKIKDRYYKIETLSKVQIL
jgi:hypothetical protein